MSSERDPNPINFLLSSFSQGWSFRLCYGFSFPASQKPHFVTHLFSFLTFDFSLSQADPFYDHILPLKSTKTPGPLHCPVVTLLIHFPLQSQAPFFFFFLKKDLFLSFFWLCWVSVAACGLFSSCGEQGYSLLWCVGFLLRCLLLLRSRSS